MQWHSRAGRKLWLICCSELLHCVIFTSGWSQPDHGSSCFWPSSYNGFTEKGTGTRGYGAAACPCFQKPQRPWLHSMARKPFGCSLSTLNMLVLLAAGSAAPNPTCTDSMRQLMFP